MQAIGKFLATRRDWTFGLTSILQLFRLSDMKALAVIQGVDCLPPVLSTDPPKRSNIRETLTEFVIADLGDSSVVSPYLIVRTPISLKDQSDSNIIGSD